MLARPSRRSHLTVKLDDRYYISPRLYEVLLTIRATAPESPSYLPERYRFEGIQARPAIDGGALRDAATPLASEPRRPELERPARQLPHQQPLSAEEQQDLARAYREEFLAAIGLTSSTVDQRLKSEEARTAMREAWKALDAHSKKNLLLGHMLREFQNAQDRDLSSVYSNLLSEISGDARKRQVLDAIEDNVREDLLLYMLFPETHLVDYLIEEIERAAQADDGLQPGEQMLKDQLKYVREGLGSLNLSNPQSWNEIRQRITAGYSKDMPNFMNKYGARRDTDGSNDV